MSVDCLVGLFRPGRRDLAEEANRILDWSDARFGRMTIAVGDGCVAVGCLIPTTKVGREPVCARGQGVVWGRVGDGNGFDPRWGLPRLSSSPEDRAGDSLVWSRQFALVVWDGASRILTIARDPLGLEPLFYAALPDGGVAVATRAIALSRLDDVDSGVDVETCAEMVLSLPRRSGATMFRGVKSLPRATTVRWETDGCRKRKYYSFDNSDDLGSEIDSRELLSQNFVNAVKRSLQGCSSPAVTLSGGLDSTSVFAVASELRKGDLQAVTMVFPNDNEATETDYSEAALEAIACTRQVKIPYRGLASITDAMRFADDPSWVALCSIMTGCGQAARASGADCLLTGEMGDFVAGYVRQPIQSLVQSRRWREVWESCSRGDPVAFAVARLLKHVLLTKSALARDIQLTTAESFRMRRTLVKAFSADVRHRYNLSERLLDSGRHMAATGESFVQETEQFFDHQAQSALGNSWLAARISGIRIEHPFCDTDLVRQSTRLSTSDRWCGSLNRPAFRASMAGRIPEQIRMRRSKARFNGPHGQHWAGLRELAGGADPYSPLGELLGLRNVSSLLGKSVDRPAGRKLEVLILCCSTWLRIIGGHGASNGH